MVSMSYLTVRAAQLSKVSSKVGRGKKCFGEARSLKGRFAPMSARLTEPMMISVMTPRTHPPVDFAAFAKEHLCYEAKMFAMTRDRIFHWVAQGLELNVYIESCILHLRNLIDFFLPHESAAG